MRSITQWASDVLRAARPSRPSLNPMEMFPSARGEAPPRGTADVLAGYATVPTLRSVTGRIAQALASTDWQVYAIRKPQQRAVQSAFLQRASSTVRRKALNELVENDNANLIVDHPLLDLLHNGNPHHTGVQLWRLTSASVDLAGEVGWLLQRNGIGVPSAIWPIPPTWILETPVPGRDSYRVNFKGQYAEIPASEMILFNDPNPSDPYGRGAGIAAALGDELATDEYAAKMVQQFFREGARPDFIMWPKDSAGGMAGLDVAERKRWKEDYLNQHRGWARAWQPYLAGQEMGVYEFGKDLSKMQLADLRRFEQDMTLQTYGMPPEMVGRIENSNRATIDAASYIFTKWLIVPRLELYRSILQARLVPMFDERIVLDYMSPVPEDTARELEVVKACPWAFQVDELRAMGGYDPLPNGGGRVFMVSPTLVPVPSFDEGPEPMVPEPVPPVIGPKKPAAPMPMDAEPMKP